MQSAIFEPFEKGLENSMTEGTGLGLAISRKHVETMGGELALTSSDTETRFSFRLKLPPAENPSALSAAHKAFAAVTRLSPGHHVRALVVDDVDTNRDVLKQILARIGVEVKTADSGRNALVMIRAQVPDIIFF